MSHQSGIRSSDELKKVFASAHIEGSAIRVIKATIEGEDLLYKGHQESTAPWDSNYDSLVRPYLEDNHGCFIFYRMDSKGQSGSDWILLCYCPDFAPVREKMLYASTRATMKREFGDYRITQDVHGTLKEEVLLEGYRKHMIMENAEAPLTMAEVEIKEIKEKETQADIGASTRRQTVAGLAFPVDQTALDKLKELHSGSINHVQLSVDTSNEMIMLAMADSREPSQLAETYPNDHPRYTIYAYDHKFEGLKQRSIIFIYMCPGYQCPVKERMLYSSCKSNVVEVCEKAVGLPVDAKVEASEPPEVTGEFLYDTVHPKDASMNTAPKFNRPKKAGRGPRKQAGK